MAAAAEAHQYQETFDWDFAESQFVAPAYAVAELSEDRTIRHRAGRFIADVLAQQAPIAEVCEVQRPINSLCEAIQRAAEGDADGRRIVELNARTDVIERTIKTGHVMDPVPLIITDAGKLIQHNQLLDSVQANSLRYAANHPIMRARTEAETRNTFRTEYLYQEGFFDEYSMLVISRAEDLPEAGFFTETMSCSLQLTTSEGDTLAIESAFVAGIAEEGAPQHDAETAVALGRQFNVDLEGLTPAQIIDTPILIHNSMIPNGVIDVVKLWDDCAGGAFFGEHKPRQDYLAFREQCRVREQGFRPKAMHIVTELINEATTIETPIQAVKRLHDISEKHMVELATVDATIDPRVFGPAAEHILMARHHLEMGNTEQASIELSQAKATAVSNSCPSGISSAAGGEAARAETNAGSDKFGSLQFKCPKGHINTRPKNQLISHCQKCGTSVKC